MSVIYFTGEVTEESAREVIDTLLAFDGDCPETPLDFIINSQGGNISDGTAIYSMLRSLSKGGGGTHHVTTWVRGMAGSIAALLVQAGDHRVQGVLDRQIWHEPQMFVEGEFITAVMDQVNGLKEYELIFQSIVHERSGLSLPEIASLSTNRDRVIFGEEALRLGLVDEVA